MYLVLSLIIIIIAITSLINYYSYYHENFDRLFTVDSPKMIPSSVINDAHRHVVFNDSGGIYYISMHPPLNAKNIKCPYFVNEYLTLGNNNFCWKK